MVSVLRPSLIKSIPRCLILSKSINVSRLAQKKASIFANNFTTSIRSQSHRFSPISSSRSLIFFKSVNVSRLAQQASFFGNSTIRSFSQNSSSKDAENLRKAETLTQNETDELEKDTLKKRRRNRLFYAVGFSIFVFGGSWAAVSFYRSSRKNDYDVLEVGEPNTDGYRLFIKKAGKIVTPWHEIPLFTGENQHNFVCEIPKGTNAKFEIATREPQNPLKQDLKNGKLRFVNQPYPSNYGALPQTYEDPNHLDPSTNARGDGDPVDVCEIGSRIAKRGEIYPVKVLGALALIDNGKLDWKVIGIDVRDALADKLSDISDVKRHCPGVLEAMREFFRTYKVPDGPENQFGFGGEFKNRDFALKIVQETHQYWRKLIEKGADGESNWITRDGKNSIDSDESQPSFLLHPSALSSKIAKYWHRGLLIDIGEQAPKVPETAEKSGRWKHLLAGGVAGVLSRTSTAPLDRLKIFLQVHASRENGFGMVSSFQYMLKEGGIKSLWRGNGVNVIKIIPESAIKFWAYEQAKVMIASNKQGGQLSVGERFVAGSIAGAISQTAVYPMEVLKTRLALRNTNEMNRGMFDALRTVYKIDGLRAFGRGYLPNLIGIVPYCGTEMAVYESLKSVCVKAYFADKDPGLMVVLGCGMVSSTVAQVVNYPLALVRTRLQAHVHADNQPSSMIGQFNYIVRHEGLGGLYRGLLPNLLKVLPSVSISYVVYEVVRKMLGDLSC